MALKPKDQRGPKMLLPADNSTKLFANTFRDGFTQSEIMTWDNCAEKWYYSYNHRLEPKGTFEWYFIYGDGVHDTLMHWYRDGEEKIATLQIPKGVILTGSQEQELAMWQGILNAQMKQYFRYYKDDLEVFAPWAVEEVVEIEFMGIKFRGKIDLGFDLDTGAKNILSDHKSYGMDDYEGWNFRFQFMFYAWIAAKFFKRDMRKFMVNGIKKPQLRLGKKESLESFIVRVEQAIIQEPKKYFVRHQLPWIKNSMEHFEHRVLMPKVNRIKLLTEASTPDMIIETLVRNQNSDNCVSYGSSCPFLPICKHGNLREGHFYTQRPHKHSELQPTP